MASSTHVGGRPRDAGLDERILAATRQLLAERGYQGLSIDAVARTAGTTRPSVYLRFAGKENLVTSAVADMAVEDPLRVTDDIRADLYLASGEIPPDWPERVVRSLWPAIQADGTVPPPDR